MNEFQKMIAGESYQPNDDELLSLRSRAKAILHQLNSSICDDAKKPLIKSLFGHTGENISLQANFYCDYGSNIYVGENFFANYNCVILDCAPVHFGDDCMLGPQVGIYTATHPIDPDERASGIESAKPIHIGDRCWIGGNATINPGVTLGNNVVVASGSVVTKSFGDNVVIAGNPAKIIREIEVIEK